MKHLILAGIGTTTSARTTYDRLDAVIRPMFDDCHIHWALSSPSVRRRLSQDGAHSQESLEDLLQELNRKPQNKIVVQSMHLTPGHEFHHIVRQSAGSQVPTAIGMPLLSAPDDYQRVAQALLPLINSCPDHAVIVVGHGTDHPSWTTYPALEAVLREYAGNRVFAATLEKFPDSSTLVDRLVTDGHHQVLIIPCLMVAGMHFRRDIIGDSDLSWKRRLECRNITVKFHDQGLGMVDGIAAIFCDHIRAAFTKLEY